MAVNIVVKGKNNRKYRILLSGESYSGKTSSFKSFGIEGHVHCINLPGEKGAKSLPEGENFHSYILEADPLPEGATEVDIYRESLAYYNAVVNLTRQIIKGDYGPADVLAWDGLLPFQKRCLDVVSEGKYLSGKSHIAASRDNPKAFDPRRMYPAAAELFLKPLGEIYYSNIPIFIATTWVKYDAPQENMSLEAETRAINAGQQKLWPNLIGQMGHNIIGEFDASIHCGFQEAQNCYNCLQAKAAKRDDLVIRERHRIWQLHPAGDVDGVGIKDCEGRKFPVYIHQDWKILKRLMEREVS